MTGQTTETDPGPTAPFRRHAGRLGLVVALAGLLLGWLVAHTEVLFADGLRYIAQARAIALGSRAEALDRAVDHPAYPAAVAAAHRLAGLGDSPEAWQAAAQGASVAAGLLLAVPLYLLALELFGDACALPACLLFYAVPLTGHVFADTLSESTFLFFWAWGLWGALRFLRLGGVRPLALAVVMSGLAYLTRPEGLLLPAALAATLALHPRWVARGLGRRGLTAAAVLVVGSAAAVGPYVALKGGLATKPSVARLLGTAPRSAAHAVERQRPLDPGQTDAKTYALAAKAVLKAVTGAVPAPLLALALLGLADAPRGRRRTLLVVILAASALALVRLHATGGYCSPRHAMIPALILLPASALGLRRVVGFLAAQAARLGRLEGAGRGRVAALTTAGALVALAAAFAPESLAPVNAGLGGYREAGRWLAGNAGAGSRVVDVTGWSQFYSGRPGYTFATLVAAPGDPAARWVVARESHLAGPWEYCRRLGALVEGREPVRVFVGSAGRRSTRVLVFDRESRVGLRTGAPGAAVRR